MRVSGFVLRSIALAAGVVCWAGAQPVRAQQTGATTTAAEPQASSQTVASPPQVVPALPVPRLIKFSGSLKDGSGQPRTGTVSLTFSIYAEQEGGATLWTETQNVELGAEGRYSVLLGSTQSEGMPLDLFASGDPRWLGVKVELPGEAEQARVLLVSVPYALKASDADTLGGKPASAYATVNPNGPVGQTLTGDVTSVMAGTGLTATPSNPITSTGTISIATGGVTNSLLANPNFTLMTGTGIIGGGSIPLGGAGTLSIDPTVVPQLGTNTVNFVPLWTGTGQLGNSLIQQSGTAIGIGESPVQALDVNGGIRASTGLATGSRNTSADAINTNALFLNGSNAMGVIGTSNAVFAPGVLFTKVSFYAGNGSTTTERMTINGTNGFVGINNTTPGQQLDVMGGSIQTDTQLISTVGTGTPPLSVASTTIVANLNAGMLGGFPASAFAVLGANSFNGNQTITGNLNVTGTVTCGSGCSGGTGGSGTVTSVGSGLGLTGGPIVSSGTLAINTAVVPQLGATSNVFMGGITASGFTGSGEGLTNVNAAMLGGNTASAFAPATGSPNYVATTGGTMTGALDLPTDGLVVGTTELVLTGGEVGVNTATPLATLDVGGTGRFANYLRVPALATFIANDTTTGTVLNKVAKLNGVSPAGVVVTATTDTAGAVGIVIGDAGTTSNGHVALEGQANCVFDGATTTGDYVQISGTVGGDCHDTGATYPISGQVLGRVLSTNAGTGTYSVYLIGPEVRGSSGAAGTVTSVAGGTGILATPTNPITSTGSFSIDPTVVPQLGAPSNIFTGVGGITATSFTSTGSGFSGSGTGLTGVNAALFGGFLPSSFPFLSLGNTFTSGTQTIQTGTAGTVGVVVQGASGQTADLQDWENNTGTVLASVNSSGVISGNGSGLTNVHGVLLTQLLGNSSLSGAQSGYVNMISDYVPPVNATAFTFNRCAQAATAAGQTLSFRSAIRTPTGTSGTVTVGTAFYLEPSTASTETIYDENNDFFTLVAGQSYDFGMNYSGSSVAGFGFCSTMVQIFAQ